LTFTLPYTRMSLVQPSIAMDSEMCARWITRVIRVCHGVQPEPHTNHNETVIRNATRAEHRNPADLSPQHKQNITAILSSQWTTSHMQLNYVTVASRIRRTALLADSVTHSGAESSKTGCDAV
jgi:hypothetical protein